MSKDKFKPDETPDTPVASTDATGPEGQTAKAVAPVKHVVEEAQKKGFRGTEADPTPNENYTVSGVGAKLPTPETDEEQYESVRTHLKTQRKEL